MVPYRKQSLSSALDEWRMVAGVPRVTGVWSLLITASIKAMISLTYGGF